ncbi:MAG: cytochrome C oxidase subunit IV family protein [Rhodoplanes sp.]|uniref:cytochrome C oxidase subunit IV family protein n=1 Tax=Rhodoplanes sp. TaxID=1968906 RepID=UPI00182D2C9F|nr:cytochrome C oxidase subunit IV family protein [Rhodoplanes sp.]NVO15050.1 cytochrome C oxidase subunit IV family protein [Rhodoplanes sp.]
MILLALTTAGIVVTVVPPPPIAANSLVIGAAVLKGCTVVLDFLGLRKTPPPWRGLVCGWVVLIAAIAWGGAAAMLLR